MSETLQLKPQTKELLARLKEEWIRRKTPNVSDRTGEWLYRFIREKKYSAILELGTANGYSTIYLASAVEDLGGSVLSVETKRDAYLEAKENLKDFRETVTLVRSDAKEFVGTLEDFEFDFIFIDAQKTETLEYFLGVRSHLKKGGTIVVDDVVKFGFKMENFYEYLKTNSISYEIVMTDPDDGVMVIGSMPM